VKQSSTYDPDATYMRYWCPEVAALPTNLLHHPYELSDGVRQKYGITTEVYPRPVVQLKHTSFSRRAEGAGGDRAPHGGLPAYRQRGGGRTGDGGGRGDSAGRQGGGRGQGQGQDQGQGGSGARRGGRPSASSFGKERRAKRLQHDFMDPT
jgi:hypothetical protein